MKKLINALLIATLGFTSIANATLITGSNYDDVNDLTVGSTFTIINGVTEWNYLTDTFITQNPPGSIQGETGDFAGTNGLFGAFVNRAYFLNTLSTTGGSLEFGNVYAIETTSFDLMPVSFLGTYIVDLFDIDNFIFSGQGILSYGSNSSTLNFHSTASIIAAVGSTPSYTSMTTIFSVADTGSSSSNPTSVPEPGTLAIFALALGAIPLAKRKKTKV